MCISVLGPEPYCFDNWAYSIVWSQRALFLQFCFSWDPLGILGPFVFMYKLKKICSALKNAIGNLIEIALNLWRLLWVVIFTVFILPIQEHSESLHLFVSSLDSFISVIVFKAQVFCIGLFLCIFFSVYTFQEWSIFLPVSLIELLQLNPSGLQSQMF